MEAQTTQSYAESEHRLPKKPPKLTPPELSELQQQSIVVSVLRRAGILCAAVPNGHVRSKRQSIQAFQEGVSAGFPDLLIFSRPPAHPDACGTVLEMKRGTATPHDVRPEQRKWLENLRSVGWCVVVGFGAKDAVDKLRQLGYLV